GRLADDATWRPVVNDQHLRARRPAPPDAGQAQRQQVGPAVAGNDDRQARQHVAPPRGAPPAPAAAAPARPRPPPARTPPGPARRRSARPRGPPATTPPAGEPAS